MKAIRILALLIGISMIFLPQAQAAYFAVSPTGSFNAATAINNTVTYDVSLVLDTTWSLAGWDVTFLYDNTELSNPTWSNVAPGAITTPNAGELHSMYFNFSWPTVADLELGAGTHLLGSFSFNIINPSQVYDGLADFSVRSQVNFPSDVFLTSDFQEIRLAGVNGADVGIAASAPVPVPAAVWLLGSGLVGLVGLRRKFQG